MTLDGALQMNLIRQGSPNLPINHMNKRQRTTTMYQRKRAVAACQVCRTRKTKCDNGRPSCGFCLENGAQCVYPGDTNNNSSYDPASLAILDRVNHVVALLEAWPTCGPACVSAKDSGLTDQAQAPLQISPENIEVESDKTPIIVDDQVDNALPANSDDDLRSFDIPEFPAACMNCESIMRWPIFRSLVPDTYSLVLESEFDEASDIYSKYSGDNFTQNRRGIYAKALQEDNFVPLSRKFLAYVHVKNPILDVASFKAHVKDAAENGLRWDGPSCLVLVACALGCLASPFQSEPVLHGTPESFRSTESSVVDLESAQAFYLAAKKRLGLFGPSLLHVQSLFLCGVFEMYNLQPQQAWFYFQQASIQLQTHLWRKSQIRSTSDTLVSHQSHLPERRLEQRLEQRLYWSCMKTECELRCELPLPPSGITRLNFPNLFPSPPTEVSSPTVRPRNSDDLNDRVEPEEEKSWFYYFAEISFRRMNNRMIMTIISTGERSWIDNIQETLKQCDHFDEEIKIWCSHIPPKITLDESKASNDELAYYIRGRALSCREFIHRPFLYCVIHQPPDELFLPQVVARAKICLDLCVENAFHAYPHHRHHGTWYIARTSLTRALLLLAAARSRKVELPRKWREAVEVSMLTVQKWYDESPDLKRAASILQNIINDTFDGLSLDHQFAHS